MNQWWQFWPQHFCAKDCDEIIRMAKTFPVVEGSVGHGANRNIIDTTIRRSQLRWLPRFDHQFYALFGIMKTLFAEANRNAFGFDVTEFHEVQFTEYNADNVGHYTWHHDTVWTSNKLFRRKLSMVIQLSDPSDYEGGQLELAEDECHEVPNAAEIKQRGTVIVFPSFLRHRVTPVTKGRRYSLVSWMEGPFFR